MGGFRHHALNATGAVVLAVSAIQLTGCATQTRGGPLGDNAEVSVKNLAAPGAFEVRNEGPGQASLSRKLYVEHWSGGGWEQVPVALEMIQRCGEKSGGECFTLPPHATVRPVPWNGYTCAPQCPGPCRANVYLGPGMFRIIAMTCDRKHRFTGPPFPVRPASSLISAVGSARQKDRGTGPAH